MNTNTLKRQVDYIVPEVQLALLVDPGDPAPIGSPQDIARFVEPLRHCDKDSFVAFYLDANNGVTGYQDLSNGKHNASVLRPLEVFKAAVLANSQAVIVARNNLSGKVAPSPQDIETTETLIALSDLLQIDLLDYVIVTTSGLCLLREHHPHMWKLNNSK